MKDIKKKVYQKLINEDYEYIPCKTCQYLKDKTENDNFTYKYSLIYLNNWSHCNCGCLYCDRFLYSKGKISHKKQKSLHYDMLPIIKDLYKHDMIDRERLRVVFHGGDLSVLKEFEPLVKTFVQNGVYKIDFSSNNIIFQPIIRDLLQQNKASLYMSLDAGNRETYRRIKRVDKFDNVINNLKTYVKASNSDNPDITVKYILLKNKNDNEKEIRDFINLMIAIGIKKVTLHLEHSYAKKLNKDKNMLTEKDKQLIKLFFALCQEYNLQYDRPDNFVYNIMTS